MLKRQITYEDFNGETITEVFYFNISKTEIVELEVEQKGGFGAWLQSIVKAEDRKAIVETFKRIILLAYGQKSDDGKRFIKNDQLKEEFSQTGAFEVLFMELATDENKAADFINGVMPKDMVAEMSKAPTPPTPPEVATAPQAS